MIFEKVVERIARRSALKVSTDWRRDEPIVSSFYLNERFSFARELLNRRQTEDARQIWDDLYRQYPDASIRSEVGVWLFIDLVPLEDSVPVIQQARRRHRRNPLLIEVTAELARRHGQFDEALRQCEILRRKLPERLNSYRIAVAALSEIGRHDESEAMLGRSVSMFPREFRLRREYAELAMERQHWAEALVRWQGPHQDYEYPIAGISKSRCLWHMGRHGEAHAVISNLAQQLPGNRVVQAELKSIEAKMTRHAG